MMQVSKASLMPELEGHNDSNMIKLGGGCYPMLVYPRGGMTVRQIYERGSRALLDSLGVSAQMCEHDLHNIDDP